MTDTPAAPTTPRFEDVAPDGRRISDVGGESALVQTLAAAMQSKLAKNRGKRHWQDATPAYLIDRLRQEVEEFEQAIGGYLEEGSADEDDVWNEAADVANFTAMLADNATGRAEARSTPAEALDVERLARAIQADIARRRPLESGQPLTAWSEVMRTAIFIRDHYEGDGR